MLICELLRELLFGQLLQDILLRIAVAHTLFRLLVNLSPMGASPIGLKFIKRFRNGGIAAVGGLRGYSKNILGG